MSEAFGAGGERIQFWRQHHRVLIRALPTLPTRRSPRPDGSPGGSGCGIVHLKFDAVYPGSAAVGNVTLHIAGCVSDPYTYAGSFTITTGVGTLSGSAPGTVTEQIVGGDLEESYQITLSVTTATGSFSGTTGSSAVLRASEPGRSLTVE